MISGSVISTGASVISTVLTTTEVIGTVVIGTVVINPRPAAAGGETESAPLTDFRDNSKTVPDIDAKFKVTYPTLILHGQCKFY